MDTKLKTALALLLSSGPLALSAALAPPANAAVVTPAQPVESQGAAARLAAIQDTVTAIESEFPTTSADASNFHLAQWANVAFGLPGWGNGWHNGGWRNGGGWGNGGGWRNGWHNGGGWRNGWHNY